MSRWFHVLVTALFLPLFWSPEFSSALAQSSGHPARAASPPALRVTVQPPKINVGRDVSLKIRVTDNKGKPVAGALVTVTGVSRPVVGSQCST